MSAWNLKQTFTSKNRPYKQISRVDFEISWRLPLGGSKIPSKILEKSIRKPGKKLGERSESRSEKLTLKKHFTRKSTENSENFSISLRIWERWFVQSIHSALKFLLEIVCLFVYCCSDFSEKSQPKSTFFLVDRATPLCLTQQRMKNSQFYPHSKISSQKF